MLTYLAAHLKAMQLRQDLVQLLFDLQVFWDDFDPESPDVLAAESLEHRLYELADEIRSVAR